MLQRPQGYLEVANSVAQFRTTSRKEKRRIPTAKSGIRRQAGSPAVTASSRPALGVRADGRIHLFQYHSPSVEEEATTTTISRDPSE